LEVLEAIEECWMKFAVNKMSFRKIEIHGQDNVYTCDVCGHSNFSGVRLIETLCGTQKMLFDFRNMYFDTTRYGSVLCEECLPADAEVECEDEPESS
jgi:hypothetical protein